jgi:hypothetical protein
MRYTLQTGNGNSSLRLNDGARPPLSLLPKAVVTKLNERDKLLVALAASQGKVAELAPDSLDHAAKAADDKAAADAARAGKSIPDASATARLEADRAKAQRELEATGAALAEVTSECEVVTSDAYWSTENEREELRLKSREKVQKLAESLADAVEAALGDIDSVAEWLRGMPYATDVSTYAVDVIPQLRSRGFARGGSQDIGPVRIRDLIINAATTVFDKEEN